MNKLISEKTILEFNILSKKIARHKRLMEEAREEWSKRYFEVVEKHQADDVTFLKMIKLPEEFER
tara:strand:+ start:846 stop:1040 length:195 start_codon:yes stop_codon:yes gene_type:complete